MGRQSPNNTKSEVAHQRSANDHATLVGKVLEEALKQGIFSVEGLTSPQLSDTGVPFPVAEKLQPSDTRPHYLPRAGV